MVEELEKTLTKRAINTFNPEFVKLHEDSDHNIFKIPAGFTAMDAISYILSDNPKDISDFLMKYAYKVPDAVEVVRVIEKGIKDKMICLTCFRNEIYSYMYNN